MEQNQGIQAGVQQGAAGPDPGTIQNNQGGAQPQAAAPQVPDDLQDKVIKDAQGNILVPLAVVQDERKKKHDLKETVKRLSDENYLYRMNTVYGPQGQAPQPQKAGAAPKQEEPKLTLPEDLTKMNDDEVVTAGELKKFLASTRLPETTGSAGKTDLQNVQVGRELLSFVAPDAEMVLNKDFVGRVQSEPYLANFVSSMPPMLRPFIAYRLGKGDSPGQAQQGAIADVQASAMSGVAGNVTPPARTPNNQVNQVLANATLPQPTSAIAGAGAIMSADRYANMTDDEIRAEVERIKLG